MEQCILRLYLRCTLCNYSNFTLSVAETNLLIPCFNCNGTQILTSEFLCLITLIFSFSYSILPLQRSGRLHRTFLQSGDIVGHRTTLRRCMFLRKVHGVKVLKLAALVTVGSLVIGLVPIGVYQSHSL